MQHIEVHILEQSYTLTCPDGAQQRLLHAARRVDAAMTAIRDAGRPLRREQVAVLAAVTIAFEVQENAAPPQEPQPEQTQLLHDLLQRLDAALQDDAAAATPAQTADLPPQAAAF